MCAPDYSLLSLGATVRTQAARHPTHRTAVAASMSTATVTMQIMVVVMCVIMSMHTHAAVAAVVDVIAATTVSALM